MLVLATDMARHSEIVEGFKSKVNNFDFNNNEHLDSVSHLNLQKATDFLHTSMFVVTSYYSTTYVDICLYIGMGRATCCFIYPSHLVLFSGTEPYVEGETHSSSIRPHLHFRKNWAPGILVR